MNDANMITLIVGIIVILFGIAAFFNQNITRWINAPGGPMLKSTIAIIVGLIFVIISLFFEF